MTKAPAAHLLGQGPRAYRVGVRRIVVYGLLWAWVLIAVALPVLGSMNQGGVTDWNQPTAWTAEGTGSDTTTAFEIPRPGLYLVAVDAPCSVHLTVSRWSGDEVTASADINVLARRVARVPFWTGTYFFYAQGACDWTIRLQRLSPS